MITTHRPQGVSRDPLGGIRMTVVFDLVLTWFRNEAGACSPLDLSGSPQRYSFSPTVSLRPYPTTPGEARGGRLHESRGCESVMARLLNFRAKARVMCV